MKVETNEEINKDNAPIQSQDEEILKEKNENINDAKVDNEIIKKSQLLNKPLELIEFDVSSHFQENISRPDKNDLGRITENSYYCINCKHSDCPFHDEEKHIIMNRIKYLLYDTHFFDEIDSKINEALDYTKYNIDVKNNINNFVDKMKEELN